jgi:hypothetical protein
VLGRASRGPGVSVRVGLQCVKGNKVSLLEIVIFTLSG